MSTLGGVRGGDREESPYSIVEIAFVLIEYDAARLPPAGALMALPIKLDHSVIHVSDWERSNTFYRDVLGAELVRYWTDILLRNKRHKCGRASVNTMGSIGSSPWGH